MAEEAAQAAPAVPKVTAPALASRQVGEFRLELAQGPSKLQLPGSSPGSQDNERPGPEENRNAFNIAEIERPYPPRIRASTGAVFRRSLDQGGLIRRALSKGESRPRAIFRSTELQRKQRLGPDVDATLSLEEWVKVLSDLLNRSRRPRIDGLDHAVGFVWEDMALVGEVLKEPTGVFIQLVMRSGFDVGSALATVLFKVFSVHSLCFVLENVLPLYLTGLHTGLVIDLGYSSSRVLPTFAGVPVLSAFSDASCGAKHLLQAPTSLVPTLIEALKVSLSTSEEAAKALEDETLLAPRLSHAADRMGADRWEDCLVCACYVACDFPEDRTPSPWDANVRIAGSEKGLRVPAACRCAATDTGRGFGLDRTGCGRSE
ncbi:Actin-related protein 10 (Actin-related protein 11) (hARP11) [Durusdinium trenchii]|uniref:Actin-related protein 10 (Actin-related protein 11) (HARP11) n=1 Tax=Durusdinium trenchii TaxID=1381693 RepID=A0ABP0MJA7_9DINO